MCDLKNEIVISIIIPIYNVEKYLSKCLESCLAQTLDNIEIICVDDYSPDNCRTIINDYAKMNPQKIVPVYLSENMRQGGARNVGIGIAKGEYLCFVDGDDYIDPKMCEILYNTAIHHNRDLVCCDGYSVENAIIHYHNVVNAVHMKTCGTINHFSTQCYMLIKKDIIEKNKLYYPEKVFSEDTAVVPLWYIKACSKEKVELPLYYAVRHDDSSRHSYQFVDQLQILICMRLLVENSKRICVYEKFKAQIDGMIYTRLYSFMKTIQRDKSLLDYDENLLQQELEIWRNYCFDNSLFNRFFTVKQIHDIHNFIQTGVVYGVENIEDDYYEDCTGNIRELFDYIQNDLQKTIVVWGYGEKGKKIIRTLHHYGYQYLVGDNNPKIRKDKTFFGDIVYDIDAIRKECMPIFLVGSYARFTDICNTLRLHKEEAIDIVTYIENGLTIEDVKCNK